MDTDGFRKAIHFDLDTATVESTFGKKNTSMAYRKIRKFLESNGFAHSQYSGYMSLRPMSDLEVYRTYDMMKEALPCRLACISLRESTHSRMANRNTPYLFDNRYIRKSSVD